MPEVKNDLIPTCIHGTMKVLQMDDIYADNDFNCRGQDAVDGFDVIDLAKDIKQRGLIEPIIVTEMTQENQAKHGKRYLLVVGYRRFMACRLIKVQEVNAVIRHFNSEADARCFNISENFHRKNLTILQEAKAMSHLLALGIGEDLVAAKLGVSRGWVQVRSMLLKLPSEVQEAASAGVVSQTQIRELYMHQRYGHVDSFIQAFKAIKDARLKRNKPISVSPTRFQKDVKRLRTKKEIFVMMDTVREKVGNGLHTRCLAWAAGEICESELMADLESEITAKAAK